MGNPAKKMLLFVATFILIMIYLSLEGLELAVARMLLGILMGMSQGFFFVKERIRQNTNGVDNVPRWIVRLASLPTNARWLPSKIWSVILGIVGPLIFLAYLIYTEGSWTELSLPISVLLTWVLTVCSLLCYLRTKNDSG